MKKLIIIFTIMFCSNINAQEYIYKDFFGVGDLSNNTHLVYRKHFSENDRSYYQLNLETNKEIIIAEDLQLPSALDQSLVGENVTDIKYYPRLSEAFLYCGQSISANEVGGYISNSDSMIFGSFWQIPEKVFVSYQNPNDIFASSLFGGYFFSNNGGNTWSVDQNYPAESDSIVPFNLVSLSLFDSNIMFGVDDNYLLKSENMGITYKTVENSGWSFQESQLLYDADEAHIYATTKWEEKHHLRISDNYGEANSWSNLISSSNEIIFCIDDSISGELYYSTNKTIYQSKDYGNNFNSIKELDFRITGLYKKPNSNQLYISTYYKIYELNLETDELKLIRTVDDFDPTQFYPLHTGDFWVYWRRGQSDGAHMSDEYMYRKIVKGDTTLENGKKYFVIEEINLETKKISKRYFERYDSSGTKVLRYGEGNGANENYEYLNYDLTTMKRDTVYAPFSIVNRDGVFFIHKDDSILNIFNRNLHAKYFKANYMGFIFYSVNLVKELGVYETWETMNAVYSIHVKLMGCRIEGVLYGDTSVVSIEDEKENLLNNFSISQNYPNPFNPTTTIKFSIPHSQFATLKVYDILGQEVKTLLNKPMQPGNYEIEFNGSNLPSGVYFYWLNSGEFFQTRKMLLIK